MENIFPAVGVENDRIHSIEFSVMPNAEILRRSAIPEGITRAELYEAQEPARGALIDLRTGTTNEMRQCDTCGLNREQCVGHFGHVMLANHVFQMKFLILFVKKILGCVCLRCSKLLVYKNEKEISEILKNQSGRKRLSEIRQLVKNVTYCQKENYGCGARVTKIKLDYKKTTCAINLYTILTEINPDGTEKESKKTKQMLTPDIVYGILKGISDADCEILGLNPKKTRPEEMIHKVFPIPPVQLRPSVRSEQMSSDLMEDDLTHKLADIVKANNRLAHSYETENASKYIQEHWHLLQYQVATYLNNDCQLPQSEQKGKITKSLCPRINGKEGRIRGYLQGKRVDFSARTVLGGDPNLDLNQVGIPVKVAMNLTYPEVVTVDNIEMLKKMVRNGRTKYPGANFYFPASTRRTGERMLPKDLRISKEKIELKIGDIVERHILDGDYVLLNRQPTLHRQSMMAFRAKVIDNPEYCTFRIVVTVVKPYNADFDGDEMNIFFPQSIMTMIELKELADVSLQIMSPATSRPIIGIHQDGLIGAYTMTDPKLVINYKDAMNILTVTSFSDFANFDKKKKVFSGSELYSHIIPDVVNLKKGSDENMLLINNGKIEKGRINSGVIGEQANSTITQQLWDKCGHKSAKNFLNDAERISNAFNMHHGFTGGFKDTLISESARKEIDIYFNTIELKLLHKLTDYENSPDQISLDILEKTIYSEMNTIRDEIGKIVINNMDEYNGFGVMMTSGAKGKSFNITQISGCVGLQAFEGGMIKKKMNHRTAPYFFRDSDTPSSRGLVKNSFLKGQTFSELFFQNMASREGVINAAVQTADSGYVQRKLIKLMEDFVVKYDKTVRSATDQVAQFSYVGSGADTTRQREYSMKIITMNNGDIADRFKFNKEEMKKYNVSDEMNNKIYDELIELRDIFRKIQIKSRLDYKVLGESFMIPVNVLSILDLNKKKNTDNKEVLTAKYILEQIDEVLKNKNTMLMTMKKKYYDDENHVKNIDGRFVKTSFRGVLLEVLSPKKCLMEYNLNKKQFDEIIASIKKDYNRNMVQPGEMVGIVSAQTMGEPTTQMSMEKNTKVLLKSGDNKFYGTISEYIDGQINEHSDNVCHFECDSCVLDMDDKWQIMSITQNGNAEWKNVLQISRHPANGNLVKVTTKSGRKTVATMSHSFLKKEKNNIVPIKGSELKVGDRIPTLSNMPVHNESVYEITLDDKIMHLDNNTGYLYGSYLATKQNEQNNSNIIVNLLDNRMHILNKLNKLYDYEMFSKTDIMTNDHHTSVEIYDDKFKNFFNKLHNEPAIILLSNIEFISGVLAGFVENTMISNKNSFTIIESRENVRSLIGLLLLYVGVYPIFNNESITISYKYSKILTKMGIPYANIDNVLYDKNLFDDEYDMIPELMDVLSDHYDAIKSIKSRISMIIRRRSTSLGDIREIKNDEIKELPRYMLKDILNISTLTQEQRDSVLLELNSDVVWDEITSLEVLDDPKEYVYDFTIPETNTFMVDDGIVVHNTLKSFHSAGIGKTISATTGVQRVKELMSLSKNIKTPQMVMYLTKEYRNNKNMASKIESCLEYTALGHIIDDLLIAYEDDPFGNDSYIKTDGINRIFTVKGSHKIENNPEIKNTQWLLRIVLNREKMLEKEVTILDIKSKIAHLWEKRNNDKHIKKEDKNIISNVTQLVLLSNTDYDKVPTLHIRFDMIKFDKVLLNGFVDFIVENFKLKGIYSINQASSVLERAVTFTESGDIEKNEQYAIYTSGINLYDIRYLNNIDIYKTLCNDVVEVYNSFGIEAARSCLIHEFILAYGGEMSYQHVSLLADLMTFYGTLTSIDRHGMGKTNAGPLSRASFERPVEILHTAAVFSEVDNMNGVSSRIMAGMTIKGGTGYCDLVLDLKKIVNSEYTVEGNQQHSKTAEITKSSIIDDVIKGEVDDDDVFVPE